MRRLSITVGTLAFAIALATAAAQDAGGVRAQMSAAEFRAAGLDKLSAAELAALDGWLQRRTAGATGAAAPTSPAATADVSADGVELERIREQAREEGRQEAARKNRGFPGSDSKEPVESTIAGDFDGFGQGNRYTLANGQVWEQVDAARLAGARQTSPEVTVRPGAFGAWYLRIKGYNTAAKVQRIK